MQITKNDGTNVANRISPSEMFTIGEKTKFLFISPHDDDVVIGGGIAIQLAISLGIEVHLLIVTDGSMGYCSEEQVDTISELRKKETLACYGELGICEENIHWLDFPDSWLTQYRGRQKASADQECVINNHSGLQNSFTHYARKIKPTHCFLPTCADLHPDHKIVYDEFLISLFHAQADIWPELGVPIDEIPEIFEMGVYCDFPENPNLQIRAGIDELEKKISSLLKYESQKQIGSLDQILRENGAVEYFRQIEIPFYSPKKYAHLFEI